MVEMVVPKLRRLRPFARQKFRRGPLIDIFSLPREATYRGIIENSSAKSSKISEKPVVFPHVFGIETTFQSEV